MGGVYGQVVCGVKEQPPHTKQIFTFTFGYCATNGAEEETTQEAIETATEEATEEATERIVFVSKSGHLIHSFAKCCGMKHYYRMTYEEARERGYKLCTKCN